MRKMMMAAAGAALALGTPAVAQNVNVGPRLVDVTIQDVSILNNFLNDAQIAALNELAIPVTVQVPVGVAANVCPNVNAGVLAQQLRQAGTANCEANAGSQALAQQVIRQHGLRQTR